MRTIVLGSVVVAMIALSAEEVSAEDTMSIAESAAREALATRGGRCGDRADALLSAAQSVGRARDDAQRARLSEAMRRARIALRACAANRGERESTAAPVRGRLLVPAEAEQIGDEGRFDQQLLIRMTRTRQAALLACYERELRSEPGLAGTVVVWVRIHESGATSARGTDASTIPSQGVRSCAEGVVARFRFRPGPEDGGVTYLLPLAFEPQLP